jgi:phosphoribosylformimino-5-aminoimidazole carboxamide ribotide isomerase
LRLLIDAGLRRAGQADSLFAAGAGRVVAGLETLASLEELEILCGAFGPRVIFSLDLKHGQPLGAIAADALSVAGEALGHGVQAMLVLDLAQVGVGCGTEDLCRRLRQAHASLELLAGGGVRDASEVQRLGEAGVDGVLVASALHDGRISPPRRIEDRG